MRTGLLIKRVHGLTEVLMKLISTILYLFRHKHEMISETSTIWITFSVAIIHFRLTIFCYALLYKNKSSKNQTGYKNCIFA
jgi:hypothetical protein